MATLGEEGEDSSRSLQQAFQSTEGNGEIATAKREDSLERTEIQISRFLISETDGNPSSPDSRHFLPYQKSTPNLEFLEAGSRTSLIKKRFQRPSARDRRRKKRNGRCENLSTFGWVFLSLALLQIIMVTGLQTLIGVLQSGPQDRYTDCVAMAMNTSADNASAPEFGGDKLIYICFFEFLVIYNFFLCIYALVSENIIEVMAFVCVNIFMFAYSCIQVYQFRGFDDDYCPPITNVGWIALANSLTILTFSVLFVILAFKLYIEFGWKQYRFVNCNPALRFYYRYYRIFLSILKLLIIFMVTFLIGQCILIFSPWLRPPLDPEFVLSIILALGMILLYFAGNIMIRRESHIGALVLVIIGVLLFCYNVFKIVRYATRTCPRCKQLQEELDIDNPANARREEFEHLILFAGLNIFFSLIFLAIVIRVWFQFGKGLADHFYFTGYVFDRIGKKEPSQVAKRDALGIGYAMTTRIKRTEKKPLRLPELEEDSTRKIKPHRGSSLDTSRSSAHEAVDSPGVATTSPGDGGLPTVAALEAWKLPPQSSSLTAQQRRRAEFTRANTLPN